MERESLRHVFRNECFYMAGMLVMAAAIPVVLSARVVDAAARSVGDTKSNPVKPDETPEYPIIRREI